MQRNHPGPRTVFAVCLFLVLAVAVVSTLFRDHSDEGTDGLPIDESFAVEIVNETGRHLEYDCGAKTQTSNPRRGVELGYVNTWLPLPVGERRSIDLEQYPNLTRFDVRLRIASDPDRRLSRSFLRRDGVQTWRITRELLN